MFLRSAGTFDESFQTPVADAMRSPARPLRGDLRTLNSAARSFISRGAPSAAASLDTSLKSLATICVNAPPSDGNTKRHWRPSAVRSLFSIAAFWRLASKKMSWLPEPSESASASSFHSASSIAESSAADVSDVSAPAAFMNWTQMRSTLSAYTPRSKRNCWPQ